MVVRLHDLTLGCVFEDLLVEVYALEGADPASKPNDPAYTAIVRDPSGYCTLVYRSSNKCQPSNVKKGRYFLISGRWCSRPRAQALMSRAQHAQQREAVLSCIAGCV